MEDIGRSAARLARRSSEEPGSVTATKCSPAFSLPRTAPTRSKKYSMKMLGSSVLPDLEETINSVLPRSTARSIALICAGSVLSSMWKRGQPDCGPKAAPKTSGPRLEPPMPSRTTLVKPRCFISSAKLCSRSTSASSSSTMVSQPSHLSSSVPVHSVLSPAHRRRMRPSLRQASISASNRGLQLGRAQPDCEAGAIAFA